MDQKFYSRLTEILPENRVREEEPMRLHTTFRVGGPARCFVVPETSQQLRQVVRCCQEEEVAYYIIGNGSNLLVSDQGYEGVVIQIFREMNRIEVQGDKIKAQAGALLSAVAARALEAGLAGFEFAAGIPGTLGGACVMNAGAYGGEMKDVLKEVQVLTRQGEIITLQKEQLEMGYRTSRIAREQYIVLEAALELKRGKASAIREKMEDLKERRVTKQPLEYPSAGSTFKRPEGYFAGKLIQDAGLRGFRIGGAQVSEKHCGFVINRDQATATEISQLIREIQMRVKENSGVELEPEVKRLGEF